MKNTYAVVFENYMNNEADQETVSLFVCSLINELEAASGQEKVNLLKTVEYVRKAAFLAANNTNDEEKVKFWLRINELIKSVIEKKEGEEICQTV